MEPAGELAARATKPTVIDDGAGAVAIADGGSTVGGAGDSVAADSRVGGRVVGAGGVSSGPPPSIEPRAHAANPTADRNKNAALSGSDVI